MGDEGGYKFNEEKGKVFSYDPVNGVGDCDRPELVRPGGVETLGMREMKEREKEGGRP